MAAYAVRASGLTKAIGLNSKASRVIAVFVALCLIAALAFLAGERHASRTTVLTGIPVVGWHEATITVGGWSYGIAGNVTWFDSQGTMHEGSWPACLRDTGSGKPITFGVVPVTTVNGSSWRQVVWVDC